MKFLNYIKEAEGEEKKNPKLEFDKAVFDLYAAIKTREFMKGEKIPLNPPERRFGYLNKKVSLIKKMITQKEKILKMASDNGFEIDSKLQNVLDQIPSKEEAKNIKVPFRLERA